MTGVKLRFLFAIFLYGTIGWLLRFVTVPTDIVVFFRASIGFLTLLVIMKIRHISPDRAAIRSNLLYLILSGASLGLNWVFLFAAYKHTTVAIASLCNYTAPIIIVAISPLVLGEKLNFRKVLCVLAALAGIVLISGVFAGEGGQANPAGIAMGLGAALGFVGLVIFNRKMSGVSYYDRSMIQLLSAAVVVLIYAVISNFGKKITVDTKSVLIILMLGVLHTGIAYCFYFDGMARLPLTTYAILGYLEPVVSVLCSVILLNEKMGIDGAAGTVLIIGAALASELISASDAGEMEGGAS
ncbi:MAG: EamA family transporter [Lachnospiraceae bacterium]|nr:EamA family transporter [Lachnospiraceae bacterium]